MKTLFSFLFIFYFSITALAQTGTFWGSRYGGNGDGGSLYRFSPDDPAGELMYTFPLSDIDGSFPESLLIASDGYMYGTTSEGGKYSFGTLFRIHQTTFEYEKIFDFPRRDGEDELTPQGDIIEGPDGFLYGYLDNYPAKLYKISKTGQSFTIIDPPSAAYRLGMPIISANDGNLYSISTPLNNQPSFIFKLTTGGTFSKIVDLTGGSNYAYTLMQASNGKLYGTIASNPQDIIFSVELNGTGYATTTSLVSYSRTDFIEDSGNLYGIANAGTDDKLFRISLSLTNYADLYTFDDQYWVEGPFVKDGGFIYGKATQRDDSDADVIFKIKFDGTGFSVLETLTNETGYLPVDIVMTSEKNLVVPNLKGNDGFYGSIVKLKTDGSEFSVIKKFYIENDGSYPGTNLTKKSNNELLGAAGLGGPKNLGVIFSINSNGDYHAVYEFTDKEDGYAPFDAPVLGPDGNYYGVTIQGGVNDQGVIYKLDLTGTVTFTKLFDFDGDNGAYPYSGLTVVDGRLYGITGSGGVNDEGVLFAIDPDGSDFEKIMEFDDDNGGAGLFSKLVYADDGFLYGTGESALYKIRPNGDDFLKLYDDDEYTALFSDPFIDENGDVILVTTRGGTTNRGGILKVESDGSGFTVLHDFDVELEGPNTITNGQLVADPDGLLWGIEPNGGEGGTGIAFRMKSDGTQYTTFDLGLTAGPIANLMPWRGLVYLEGGGLLSQTIDFPEVSTKTIGVDVVFELDATASSELPITYSTTSDKISIANGLVGILKAGRASIKAEQNGDDMYEPAPAVERSFCINPAKPHVTSSGTGDFPTLTSSNDDGNQWYLDGDPIENATEKTFQVTEEGTYSVKTTVDDCTSDLSDEKIVTITGLGETPGVSVTVFPNPVATEIYLRTTSPAHVSMIDVTGRTLEQRSMTGTEERFDVRSLQKGVYFFRVQSNDKVIIRSFVRL